MHVLHAVGGVDVYLRILLNHIDTEKFELIIVHGTDDAKIKYSDKNGNSVKEYSIPVQREIKLLQDFRCVKKLRRIIRSEKPDIIHSHSAKGGIIARTAALGLGIKEFYTPHAFSYLSSDSKIKKNIFLAIEKLYKYSGNYVLATSNSEKNRSLKEVGYQTDKVLVFHNSVEPIQEDDFAPIQFDLPENYICSIGRPSYQKNIENMVEVFNEVKKQIPDLSMVLMGVGFHAPNEQSVKDLIQKYKLEDSFIMLPWVSRNEIFPIVKKSKLYISTSRYEGLPYSIIEAMALGKACVVSDCDGNRDLIINDVSGKVYAQENIVREMSQGIIDLIQNEDKRRTFENKSHELFEQNYNITKTISLLEEIYSSK